MNRDEAIAAHLAAHEARVSRRRNARIARALRNKRRGLGTFVVALVQSEQDKRAEQKRLEGEINAMDSILTMIRERPPS